LGVYSNTTNEDSILYVDNVRIATIPTTNVAATKMDNNIEITFPNTVVGGVANISASDITVQKVADRSVTVPVTGVSVSESNGLVLATDGFANGEYCIKFKNTVTTIAGEEIDEIYFDAFGLIQEPVVNFIDDGSKATAWGTNWNDPANMFDEATEDSAYGKIYKSTSGEDDMFFNFETPVKPGGKLVFSADYKSSDYYARVQFLVRDRVDNDKQMVGSAGKNAVALALGGGASNSYVVLLKGNHSSIDGAIKDPNKNLVATNAWTKIKLVLDLEKHTRELYVNDVFVQSDSNWHVTEYGTSNITDTIWGIGIHCFPPANYGGGDSSIACLDNISITAYNTESSIKARFVDLSGVEHAPNTTLPVDINAVKIYAGAEGLTADDFAGATLGGVSLAGGTFADGVYTKDLGGILDPTTAYTLSVPAISTMPAYTTTFTTRAGEFRVDSLKIVKPDGSAIALNEVTAGTQLKLVVEAVNTTGITQTPVMLYGVYNDGFFKQADIKALSFESVGPVSDSITFTVEDATELQVKGFLWENMNTMMPYISAVEL